MPALANAQGFEKAVIRQRINAHGDEFNAIALNASETRLAVGTEKGELIIWDLVGDKLERKFTSDGPIHELAFLNDDRTVVTAGGPHFGPVDRAVLHKWNIDTGVFASWSMPGKESLMTLTVDPLSSRVAAADGHGLFAVWDGSTGKLLASWTTDRLVTGLALAGDRLIVNRTNAAVSKLSGPDEDEQDQATETLAYSVSDSNRAPETFIASDPDRTLLSITTSPDGRWLAVETLVEGADKVLVFAAESGREVGAFEATDAAWRQDGKLQLFNESEPTAGVTIANDTAVTEAEPAKSGQWHQAGQAARMTGTAASRDGRRVWATFARQGVLAEYDLSNSKRRDLINSGSLVYTMAVRAKGSGGYLASGGDDGYVRVWALSGLELVREFKMPLGVPQGVAILNDGKRVVYSCGAGEGPTEIWIADIVSGERRELLKLEQTSVSVRTANDDFLYPLGNKIIIASTTNGKTLREFEFGEGVDAFNVSANAKWLAVADKKGALWLVDLTTGRRTAAATEKIEDPKQVAVSDDGRFVYSTEWGAVIRRWDTRLQTSLELSGHRGQAASLALSTDERHLVVGGNHFDIGVYDSAKAEQLFDTRVDGADFYVTNAWMGGNRMIFTTDGGLMFEYVLSR